MEGINNLTFTVEDVAGNKKDFSFSYVIDTIAPVPPTVSLEDFVVLPNGIILSGNDLPALVGTAEPKSTILLMRDGKLYDSIEVDSNGTGIISLVINFFRAPMILKSFLRMPPAINPLLLNILLLFKLKLYLQKRNSMPVMIPVQKATGLPINIML